jgi:CHAD domain-containing protein
MPAPSPKEYRSQLRKAWRKARHSLDEDSVHDLRVASRRMSAALLLLESVLRKDRSSKARRGVTRLTKKLGPLRDIQVQIRIVRTWNRTVDLQRFENSLVRTERQEKNRVLDYLSPRRQKRILQQLKAFEKESATQLRDIPQATIQRRLQNALSVRRMDLQAARKAMTPSDLASLHTVRRAARKLRYCLEAATETVDPAQRAELQRLRRYQTDFGNKRDQQLLAGKFEEWQRRIRGRTTQPPNS